MNSPANSTERLSLAEGTEAGYIEELDFGIILKLAEGKEAEEENGAPDSRLSMVEDVYTA